MSEKYNSMLNELQACKKQLQSYKIRVNNIERENSSLYSEVQTLTQANHQLKTQLEIQNGRVRALQEEKQQLVASFTINVEAVKQEIENKQQQLEEIKERNVGVMGGGWLAKKQIQHQLEMNYTHQIESKDNKITDLQNRINQLIHQRDLDREKHALKIKSLQSAVSELESQKLRQIKEYAERAYRQSSQNKNNSEDMIVKRLRRELDEVRGLLSQKNTEMEQILQEKTNLHRQVNKQVHENEEEKQKLRKQMTMYRLQCEKANRDKAYPGKQDQLGLIRNREKQIKKLRDQVQQMHQQIKKKDEKITNIQLERLQLQQLNEKQKKIIKNENFQVENEHYHEKQHLLKTIKQMKQQHQQAIKQIKKQLIQEHKITKENIVNEINTVNRKNILKEQSVVEEKHNEEKKKDEKLKQITQKYIELKKRYVKIEDKLKQANDKVVELLKNKIILGSPKGSTKKTFAFPSGTEQTPTLDKQFYQKSQNMRKDYLSPQAKPNIENTKSEGQHNHFYDRCLKLKKRGHSKDFKCLNHEQQP